MCRKFLNVLLPLSTGIIASASTMASESNRPAPLVIHEQGSFAVGGTVVAVNTALADHPELINDDAFEEGWMVKIKTDSPDPLHSLLSCKEYAAFVRNL